MRGTAAFWLVCSSPDRVVRVWLLAGDIVYLCSWARHFTLTSPLATQVYKWVLAILLLRVTLRQTGDASCYRTRISSGLMGHLACLQTIPTTTTTTWHEVPELSDGPAMCETVEIELVCRDDTVAGDADPLGLFNLVWSAGFYKQNKYYKETLAQTESLGLLYRSVLRVHFLHHFILLRFDIFGYKL